MSKGEPIVEVEEMAKAEALEDRLEFGTARQMIEDMEDFEKPQSEELLRVNIPCGKDIKEGWINVDKDFIEGVDVMHPLFSLPWPFEENSVYEMRCNHFVQYIPHDLCNGNMTDGLIQVMEEIHRVLMPSGTVHIIAPYYTSMRAWQDPESRRHITDVTWSYFNKKHMESQGLKHYADRANFEPISRHHILDDAYVHRAEEARLWALKHNWNVVKDLAVVLRAIK